MSKKESPVICFVQVSAQMEVMSGYIRDTQVLFNDSLWAGVWFITKHMQIGVHTVYTGRERRDATNDDRTQRNESHRIQCEQNFC